ncbi:MAG: type II secretion system F family protein [Synoicihabitans sp.]
MPQFTYVAIDGNSGREDRGVLAGESEAQVIAELKSRGLFPTQLRVEEDAKAKKTSPQPKKRPAARRLLPGMTPGLAKTRTLFTRQLATLLKAGMPILRGLEVLAKQQAEGPFKKAVTEIGETIRSGGSFSDGLSRYPKIFEPLYLNMVKAGEAAGALDVVLERLAEFLEKSQKIRAKVKSAMMYPLIIMAVATGVVGALVVFVIPRFESIFANMLKGESLPVLTQAVLGLSRFVQHQVGWTLLIAAAVVVGLRMLVRTKLGERLWHRMQLLTPVLGDLVRKAAVARFSRTLGTLLSSGVQILEALNITRDTAGNVHVADAVDAVRARVRAGEGVAGPLEETGVFPAMVPSMIEVGEETGKLPDMLHRVADTYEEEVDNAVAALTSILEPLMIVLMSLMVGTIVVALFLPLVRVIQNLS